MWNHSEMKFCVFWMGQTLILMISDPFYVIFYFFDISGKSMYQKNMLSRCFKPWGTLFRARGRAQLDPREWPHRTGNHDPGLKKLPGPSCRGCSEDKSLRKCVWEQRGLGSSRHASTDTWLIVLVWGMTAKI